MYLVRSEYRAMSAVVVIAMEHNTCSALCKPALRNTGSISCSCLTPVSTSTGLDRAPDHVLLLSVLSVLALLLTASTLLLPTGLVSFTLSFTLGFLGFTSTTELFPLSLTLLALCRCSYTPLFSFLAPLFSLTLSLNSLLFLARLLGSLFCTLRTTTSNEVRLDSLARIELLAGGLLARSATALEGELPAAVTLVFAFVVLLLARVCSSYRLITGQTKGVASPLTRARRDATTASGLGSGSE